jgi:hypothetical protein
MEEFTAAQQDAAVDNHLPYVSPDGPEHQQRQDVLVRPANQHRRCGGPGKVDHDDVRLGPGPEPSHLTVQAHRLGASRGRQPQRFRAGQGAWIPPRGSCEQRGRLRFGKQIAGEGRVWRVRTEPDDDPRVEEPAQWGDAIAIPGITPWVVRDTDACGRELADVLLIEVHAVRQGQAAAQQAGAGKPPDGVVAHFGEVRVHAHAQATRRVADETHRLGVHKLRHFHAKPGTHAVRRSGGLRLDTSDGLLDLAFLVYMWDHPRSDAGIEGSLNL